MIGEPAFDQAALARLLEITGGDDAFVDELVDTYLDDAIVQLDALRGAAIDGDIGAMVRPAHSLKSSSDNVGAVALTTICRALETDARGGSVPQAVERVAAVELAFGAAREALLEERAAR